MKHKLKCDCGCENILIIEENGVPRNTVVISIESGLKKSFWIRLKSAWYYLTGKERLLLGDNIIVNINKLKILEKLWKEDSK